MTRRCTMEYRFSNEKSMFSSNIIHIKKEITTYI